MSKGVVLPTRSWTWARGRREAARSRPGVGSGFCLKDHIGPDRFRHALKNAYWASSMILCSCGNRWRGRDRRKFSFNDKEIPRLTGRSCGEFAGIGRTLPFRHLRNPISCRAVGELARSVRRMFICRSPAREVGLAGSRNHPSSGSCLRHYGPCGPLCGKRFWGLRTLCRHTREFRRIGLDSGL